MFIRFKQYLPGPRTTWQKSQKIAGAQVRVREKRFFFDSLSGGHLSKPLYLLDLRCSCFFLYST
jgi:hypothetical protein